ncbi:hypothetical protein [uncultured Sphingobacterium sp.]|uniref:hypothetical protein n=1 Tax=uncultured Sphingobacterium sp. TaxID=182688 RepID=UPI0025D8F051|nr:hypothetical protein [uncultured Sphingobacterium sp.]
MSIEITLYTKTATKTGLIKFLLANNFKKTRHFLEEMNTDEMLHFMWFGFDNYESSTGVEATVLKASLDYKTKYNCSDWILHTRTRSSGTFEDKQKQNDIIRIARKQFGGTFYNDWYGTNKYTNLEDYKKFSPLEKGISIIASNSLEKLWQISNCLSGYRNEMSEGLARIMPETMRTLLISKDPSTVLYNSLMPFLVSVLEYFFGQCFVHYIKYDETARRLLSEEKMKIGITEVISVLDKENSLEQIVAQSYNFQNLDSMNKAFKKYLSLDLMATLSKRKKINGNIFRILTRVQELLEARHRFVHELDINYSLSKQMYLDYILTVEKAIELTLTAFKEKGLTIEIDH